MLFRSQVGYHEIREEGEVSTSVYRTISDIRGSGRVAYRVDFLPQLASVHPVFHVSMLRKYIPDLSHVISYDDLHVDENVTYEVRPVRILDTKEQTLRRKIIRLVKVLWQSGTSEEMTWEREATMRAKFPELFDTSGTYFLL